MCFESQQKYVALFLPQDSFYVVVHITQKKITRVVFPFYNFKMLSVVVSALATYSRCGIRAEAIQAREAILTAEVPQTEWNSELYLTANVAFSSLYLAMLANKLDPIEPLAAVVRSFSPSNVPARMALSNFEKDASWQKAMVRLNVTRDEAELDYKVLRMPGNQRPSDHWAFTSQSSSSLPTVAFDRVLYSS